MPCFYPIRAWKSPQYHNGKFLGNSIIFDERKGDAAMELRLPCGQCDGCRLERARQWAVRCMHEASLHEQNCFITLTYNDDHLPLYGSLVYDEFQRFMKRLRKKFSKKTIRFFMCGEYGDDHSRPHFHACIFGLDFDDRVYLKTSPRGEALYTSKTLEALWTDRGGDTLGFCTVGNVNINSAGYVARYSLKKSTRGTANDLQYQEVDMETGEVFYKEKEFVHMSLKPGIGAKFYEKWYSDIYPNDYVVVNGKRTRPPVYYSKKLAKDFPDLYNQLQEIHCMASLEKQSDNTEERLRVKEAVQKAAIKFLKRELF